jgi:hypothetical protein
MTLAVRMLATFTLKSVLHGLLDLGLAGVGGHFKYQRTFGLAAGKGLLGNKRAADDVIDGRHLCSLLYGSACCRFDTFFFSVSVNVSNAAFEKMAFSYFSKSYG